MTKALWWVAGAVGVVWLLSQNGGSSASRAATNAYGSGYSTPTEGSYGRYAPDDAEVDADEAEERAEEVRRAKQMSSIRSRLEDADEALSQLESLRPGDPAVQSARDEVDSMRSHMTRLHFENWRTVRPDLDTSASAIEDEAGSVSEEADED
jgi:acyl-CoA reductase-like NAD-dependent aldehyde dehydrogenase